jgi:hypothetical protein
MSSASKPLSQMNIIELEAELRLLHKRIPSLLARKAEVINLLNGWQAQVTTLLKTCGPLTPAVTHETLLVDLKFQKNFETRIQLRLRGSEMKTVGDLLSCGETLLHTPGFGKKSIDEIKRVLALHGLTLPKFSSK